MTLRSLLKLLKQFLIIYRLIKKLCTVKNLYMKIIQCFKSSSQYHRYCLQLVEKTPLYMFYSVFLANKFSWFLIRTLFLADRDSNGITVFMMVLSWGGRVGAPNNLKIHSNVFRLAHTITIFCYSRVFFDFSAKPGYYFSKQALHYDHLDSWPVRRLLWLPN